MDSNSFNSFKLTTMWLLAHMDQKLFKLKNPSIQLFEGVYFFVGAAGFEPGTSDI